tara:strand:+ start:995 stop:1867 length:873 start_codon:yes stop_codon:yes gene_type:complete
MTLDADKQELGQFSQKEPLKFGFLKEKAREAGLSTQDFIGQFADKIMKQQDQHEQPKNNTELIEIKEILKEQTKALNALASNMLIQQRSQPEPTDTSINQLSGLIGAFRELQNYNNSVIDGYRSIKQDVVSEIGDLPYDDEDKVFSPEDYFLKVIADKMAGQGAKAGLTPSYPAAPPVQQPQNQPPFIVPNSQQEVTQEQRKMDPQDIDKIADEIPPQIKEAIRRGTLTLESAKQMVKGNKYGAFIKESDIEKVYTKIKGEDKPVTGKEQPNEERLFDAVKSKKKYEKKK